MSVIFHPCGLLETNICWILKSIIDLSRIFEIFSVSVALSSTLLKTKA